MIGILLFTIFLIFLFFGLPVGFALGIASLGGIAYGSYPISVMAQRFFTAVDSFPLMAIPLFMLAGALMSHGGITKRIIDFALCFVGHIKGGLAMVVAITGIIMGGISGSGVADAAAIGAIMVPEMSKRKYDRAFSGALCACCGSIGLIIPPSIAIIIFACTANVSIGDLFMAAYAPGICIGLGFLLYCYIIARIKNYPNEEKIQAKETIRRFKDAIWALIMPLIIVVGIRGGIFTATEGGAVISIYGLLVGMFIYKDIKIKDLPAILLEAAESTATIGTIICATTLFSWLLTSEQIPAKITTWLISLTDNKFLLLFLINVLLLITGMFIDSGPAIMLLAPILCPVATSLGVNLVQFGLVMVMNLTIGLLTPPVGTAMYVGSNVSGVPIKDISRALLPFIGIMFAALMLVTYGPAFTSWAY
ncbi:MAG: TRAP transporter large permease [Eubacteriales bacterium]|nr:TRAP transporter large permease [Eubacteriales bacterium]